MFLANILILGGVSLYGTNSIIDSLSTITEVYAPASGEMATTDMMHDAIRGDVLRAIVSSGDKALNDEILNDYSEHLATISKSLSDLEKLPINEKSKAEIASAKPALNAYIESSKAVIELATSGKVEQAMKAWPEFQEKFEGLEGGLGALSGNLDSEVMAYTKESKEQSNKVKLLNMSFVAVGFLVGLIFSLSIMRDLRRALESAIHKVGEESQSVTVSAQQLNSAAQDLSNSGVQQASALQETAASMDEIGAMIRKTSESSKQLEKTAQMSHQSANRGKDAITQMLQAMQTISDSNTKVMNQVEEGNQKITEIVRVIGEIGNKTKVINDIVFQTKLLSFNASVEAARAGEHGKGFAVVAEEVGNLAQMSGNAAKEISDMLATSLSRVDGIVADNKQRVETLIVDGKSKLDLGTSVARQCNDALEEIVKQASDVGGMVSEITTAIQEQNQGIQEISKAIALLDESTQTNASAAKQTSVTSRGLLGQAKNLTDIVASLQALVLGNATENGGHKSSSAREDRNVVEISAARSNSSRTPQSLKPHQTLKPHQSSESAGLKVAGGGDFVPNESDPRFEDM